MSLLQQRIKQLFNSPLGLFLIAMFCYGIFVSHVLWRNNFDFSHFIIAGNIYVNQDELKTPIKILRDCGRGPTCGGYDGQFYYRLALNPFTNDRTEQGITIDLPSLRMQRILYPLAGWIFSFGSAKIVPIILVMLNLFAVSLIALFAGLILRTKRRNIYWGLAVAFYPAFLFTLARDLTEIFGIVFLSAAYWLFLKEKKILAGILAALAVLARETTLIFALGFLVAYLFELILKKKKFNLKDVFVFSCPIGVFAVWQAILAKIWPSGAVSSSIFYNITWPFRGLYYHLQNGNLLHTQNYFEFIFIILIIATVFWTWRSSRAELGIKFSMLLSLLIFSLLSKSIWVEDWSFMRAFSELYFFSVLIILQSDSKLKIYLAPVIFAMWLAFYKIALLGQLF